MARITIDLGERKIDEPKTSETSDASSDGNISAPKKRGTFFRILNYFGILLVLVLVGGAIGGYFYWQHLKTTPQYSLALLIDAARRGDRKTVDELVDADAIVDDFMPQITDKAIELYGRGVSPATIARAAQVAAPVLPAVKVRARAEIPELIRSKTEKFNKFPFWAITLGASRYIDIKKDGDKAVITSKIAESPLNLTVKRNGVKWQVVGIKDEELAKNIAGKIGQQIVSAATKNGAGKAGEALGAENLSDMIRQLDGIFK